MLTFQPTMLFICNPDERKKKSVRKAEMVVWRSCIEDQRGKCRFGELVLSNFTFSFSIISVLVAGVFTMAVGLSISEICLSYPTSGGLYSWRNLLLIVGHPFPLGSLAGKKLI
ncbi:hypothetical protein Hanom_Chr01g00069801 [Helianthus anomalus]